MLRKLLFPIFIGVAGCGVLIALGLWQVERLAWKEGVLAGIQERLTASPKPLSLSVSEAVDEYTPVTLSGRPTGDELHVLVSGTEAGTGYRVISKFQTSLGAILIDQGLLAIDNKAAPPLIADMQITGTILWPDDQNAQTPEPDLDANIWFARNIGTMSDALDAQPLMVVASNTVPADPRLSLLPVNTTTIKNDHFEYAVTWFLLAAVWAIMSLYLILRTTRPKKA